MPQRQVPSSSPLSPQDGGLAQDGGPAQDGGLAQDGDSLNELLALIRDHTPEIRLSNLLASGRSCSLNRKHLEVFSPSSGMGFPCFSGIDSGS